jgi:RND family efflux transporter MFP subunit
MSGQRKKILVPIIILLGGALAAAAMVASRKPAPRKPPEEFAPLVRVITTTTQSTRLTVTTHGTVAPRTETALVAEVAGRVLSIAPSFASGGFFKKGDVILQIDPVDYELAAVAARSAVAQARVRLEQEEAQSRLAREEWQELGNGEANALATRELQLDEARAALAAADARLRQAERNLERATVRAPFACRVRDKAADVGQYVNPGVALAHIFATDTAEIRLPIPDADFAFLDLPIDFRAEDTPRAQRPVVHLRADLAGEPREWTARVARVEGEIDPRTRMVYVVARADDPYGSAARQAGAPLAVGLFVEAEIEGRMIADAIVLPRSALRRGDVVLVVDESGQIHFRPVVVVRAGRENVVIGGGLSAGEKVCVSNIETVTDGMAVRTEDFTPGVADTTAAREASR